MTWNIIKNIQNKPLKYTLVTFGWNVQNILDNYCSGTLWLHDLAYFEFPNNIPSWDMVAVSVWYILNMLNMCQFGTGLVL